MMVLALFFMILQKSFFSFPLDYTNAAVAQQKKFAREAKGVMLGEMKALVQLEVNPNLYRLPIRISVHSAENEFQLNCSHSKALAHLLYIIPQSHFTQS